MNLWNVNYCFICLGFLVFNRRLIFLLCWRQSVTAVFGEGDNVNVFCNCSFRPSQTSWNGHKTAGMSKWASLQNHGLTGMFSVWRQCVCASCVFCWREQSDLYFLILYCIIFLTIFCFILSKRVWEVRMRGYNHEYIISSSASSFYETITT